MNSADRPTTRGAWVRRALVSFAIGAVVLVVTSRGSCVSQAVASEAGSGCISASPLGPGAGGIIAALCLGFTLYALVRAAATRTRRRRRTRPRG